MVFKDEPEKLHQFILDKIQPHVPAWQVLSSGDIQATLLSGLSNIAYRVKITAEHHKEVKP